MKGRLSRLEARVEALVEGTFARLFAGHVHPRDVAVQLARALEDSAASGLPATHYTVRLHPADAHGLLQAHPDLADMLAAEVVNLARDAQLTLAERPVVSLETDAAQAPHTIYVTAGGTLGGSSSTQTMAPVRPADQPRPPRAFLILDGDRTVPIGDTVITLGRRFDNQIILDDPRVSRAHAQLRLRFGRYVVYDLGSTGGTFVNGQRVDECVLRPGDVISLGGVPVIYGEDDLNGETPGPAARSGATRGNTAALPPAKPGDTPLP